MTDALGARRERVALYEPARAADDLGGAALSWTLAEETWARVEAGGASLAAALDGAVARSAYTLTIRAPSNVRAGWRAAWGARFLRVQSVVQTDPASFTLACEEEQL